MLLAFLRLFPAFRALEAELQESAAARIAAEDKVRVWQARVESAEKLRDEAMGANIATHKTFMDWVLVNSGMKPVYGQTTPSLEAMFDEANERVSGHPHRRQAREIAEELSKRNRQQAFDRARATAEQNGN